MAVQRNLYLAMCLGAITNELAEQGTYNYAWTIFYRLASTNMETVRNIEAMPDKLNVVAV
jgi:hypothetical protein